MREYHLRRGTNGEINAAATEVDLGKELFLPLRQHSEILDMFGRKIEGVHNLMIYI